MCDDPTREKGMIEWKETTCGRFTIMNTGALNIRVKGSALKYKVESLVSKVCLCDWWYYDIIANEGIVFDKDSFACDENILNKHATYAFHFKTCPYKQHLRQYSFNILGLII